MQMTDRQFRTPRHNSRRFTTLEGWYEVGEGVFSLGQRTLILGFADQFDLERQHDDVAALGEEKTRNSGQDKILQHNRTSTDSRACNDLGSLVNSEKPYHIYTSREKWRVVVLVGAAGLFSGLSSNIYFPSLDVIAKASNLLHQN